MEMQCDLEPIALATLVLIIARGPQLPSPARWGDFSYGVYIVHFPVIQLAIHFGATAFGGLPFLLLTLSLTMLGGVVFWHGIEKRFLRRDSHYRQSGEVARKPS